MNLNMAKALAKKNGECFAGIYRLRLWILFFVLQADLCMPQLQEGDEITLINGQDVKGLTHREVICLIPSSSTMSIVNIMVIIINIIIIII